MLFIVAVPVVVNYFQYPKCSFMEDWLTKGWYTYTMEYWIAIKKQRRCIYELMVFMIHY